MIMKNFKNLKKEIKAIAIGFGFAYIWQLFAIFMASSSNNTIDYNITISMFIPSIGIQIVIVPLISWILMGLFKVHWYPKWLRITSVGFSFLIPFGLISALTVFVAPHLWYRIMYWIINIGVSIVLSFTLFKPLLRYRI